MVNDETGRSDPTFNVGDDVCISVAGAERITQLAVSDDVHLHVDTERSRERKEPSANASYESGVSRLRVHLNADTASVHVLTLPPGSAERQIAD